MTSQRYKTLFDGLNTSSSDNTTTPATLFFEIGSFATEQHDVEDDGRHTKRSFSHFHFEIILIHSRKDISCTIHVHSTRY